MKRQRGTSSCPINHAMDGTGGLRPINGPKHLLLLVDGLDSEAELEEYMAGTGTLPKVPRELFYLGAIVFDNPEAYKTGVPHNISYTIR